VLYGHESELAPLVAKLEAVAAKAAAHARYLLKPGTRSPVTIVPWPVRGVELRRFYDLTEAAAQQERQGADRVPGDFEALRGPAPASIPLYRLSVGVRGDPQKNVFFSQNGTLYRIERPPDCGRGGGVCRVADLMVEDVLTGGASLDIPGAVPNAHDGRLTRTSPRAIMGIPGSTRDAKVIRMTPFAWWWPAGTGVELRNVPPDGTVIDAAAFDRLKSHYRMMLRGGPSGTGRMNFIEGNVIYENVQLCHIAPGAPGNTCEKRQ
jgi:hypothetical protein